MTLIESVVALVILGLAAVGFLDAFQISARSARQSMVWIEAVNYAEASVEQVKAGLPLSDDTIAGGFRRQVTVAPWPGPTGLAEVTVTIELPHGGSFQLKRLLRTD